jgi:2-methylisocitrate lyase-like PEP mutase family enzyme
LLATGVVGCNFEDQVIGQTGLHSVAVQVARIRALRDAATACGVNAFINARTDVFLKAPLDTHDATMVDEAIERGRAYADAGASGLFLPGLANEALIARACEGSRLPVNIMVQPEVPAKARLAELGVARISHGAGPWRLAMRAFTDAARAALQ